MINVLIVEDDPMVAEFNKHYISLIPGFTLAAVAHSAAQAEAFLMKYSVDLLMLDIFMPGKSGMDLLQWIREQAIPVDVIVVSAACDREHIRTAMRLGAVDYLIKPFEFERLQSALDAYRNWAGLMERQEQVRQEELDQRMLHREQALPADVPKGIDRKTLQVVWSQIKQQSATGFSTEELANAVGISRISMRKYLEFLKQIGVVQQEVSYGSVGRPIFKFRCHNPLQTTIERYL